MHTNTSLPARPSARRIPSGPRGPCAKSSAPALSYWYTTRRLLSTSCPSMAKTKSLQPQGITPTRIRASQSPPPPSSPLRSSRQTDLAALEAHFLASFAGADFEQQRKQEIKNGKRRAPEASPGALTQGGKKGLSRQQGETATTTPLAQPPRRQPAIVVFDEGDSGGRGQGQGQGSQGATMDAKKNWKDFMVSRRVLLR